MMYTNKLSSASNLDDQPNDLMDINYISIIGGCALILTATILTSYFTECCKRRNTYGITRTHDGNQRTSNVVDVEGHTRVVASPVTETAYSRRRSMQTIDWQPSYNQRPQTGVEDRSTVNETRSNRHAPIQTTNWDSCLNQRHQTGVEDSHNVAVFTIAFTNNRQKPRSSTSPSRQTRSKDLTATLGMVALQKPRGLVNNGRNTCYFNSTLQALAHTSILQTQLGDINECGAMIRTFRQFYTSLHGSETRAFDPQELQRLLSSRTSKFAFGEQHDSHECLLKILHELRNDERKRGNDQLTVVDKIFGGHNMTVYECKRCGTPMHLCEPFLDISLPIYSRKNRKGSAKRSHGGAPYMPSRPLPQIECGIIRGTPEPSQSGIALTIKQEDITDKYIELGNENRRNELKRRKQRDDSSRDRNTASKIQKREPSQDNSKFATPKLTLQVTSAEQDPILKQKEEYKAAVRFMMSTISTGRAHGDLCTIEDCLRRYTRSELLNDEYLCRECNSNVQDDNDILLTSATKKTLIFNPPAVLTIHLKRFEHKSGEYVKLNTLVRYDEVLDIRPYCSAWLWPDIRPNDNIWYSLYDVVVHLGVLQFGHYIAYVKVREHDQKIRRFLQRKYLNRDNVTAESLIYTIENLKEYEESRCTECPANKEDIWYCMNDEKVNRVSVQDVLHQEAFLLFYERI